MSSKILKRHVCGMFLGHNVPTILCRACCRSPATALLLLFHSAAAALILLTCLLLGAPLALCCYCRLTFLVGFRLVFLLRPDSPASDALILREVRNLKLVMFHPSASSSPCGLFCSLTALKRPTPCKMSACPPAVNGVELVLSRFLWLMASSLS